MLILARPRVAGSLESEKFGLLMVELINIELILLILLITLIKIYSIFCIIIFYKLLMFKLDEIRQVRYLS